MTRFHRLIGSVAAVAMLIPTVPAFAAFSDVGAKAQYSAAINALQKKGVLQGYANGTFKPSARINRAEFVKIIAAAAFDADFIEKCKDDKAPFHDVNGDDWFAKYVCVLRTTNAVSGYPDGTFRPGTDINFAEASKILATTYSTMFQENGEEWFTGPVRKLESAKAIPDSVAKLDSFLTRGEMAEMIWRLTENKTDQPTKGLLNLQHPELKINTASDSVQFATSCTDLQAFAATAQATTRTDMYYMKGGPVMMEADGAVPPMAPAPNAGAAKTAGGDYSQTNVQVQGVDEADIVKTDGTYLYVLSTREKPVIRIVRATPASSMKVESTIDLGAEITPTELYVDDGKLIVIGPKMFAYPMPTFRDSAQGKMMAPGIWPGPSYIQRTDVRIYDVSNAASPTLDRTVSFDGYSVSTRKIGSRLYLVLQQPMPYWGGPVIMNSGSPAMEKPLVPQFEDSRTGKTVDAAPCARIAILPRVPSPQYMTVAMVPTDSTAKEVKTTVVLGSAQNVYASLQNLYVATSHWNYRWTDVFAQDQEKTRIYRFAFTETGAELKAQGEVPGHILNQFSMDEHEDHFRIATTIQQWDMEGSQSTNDVHVLGMDMKETGAVTNIAPGETIYSVRFMGDRAYMVTFKTVDPFFVIDMSNPRNPKVLGALKIPGFSNYLHPYDDTHVIGFGKDVDESIDADKVHSTDAIYYTAVQGLKMAMFDVTDVANPRQMFVEVIGDRGTDSPLLSNHKALLFDKDRGLLSFPILVTKRPAGTEKSADGNPYFQGAYVYNVNLQKGFGLRGTITHYDNTDEFIKAGSYWYGGERDIQRIVRIGSQLLTVSDAQVRSHDEATVKEAGKVELK